MKKGALVSSLAMAPAVRVGRWGGVGTRERPGAPGIDGERKECKKPGSKVFLGAEKKAEKGSCFSQVCVHAQCFSPPQGCGQGRPSSQPYNVRVKTLLEAAFPPLRPRISSLTAISLLS